MVSVGAAADEAELWTLVRRTHPSLVVLDLHRRGRHGLLLRLALKATVPTPAVLVHAARGHRRARHRDDDRTVDGGGHRPRRGIVSRLASLPPEPVPPRTGPDERPSAAAHHGDAPRLQRAAP